MNAMRDEFRQKMEGKKKKKLMRPMKLCVKSKIITKGTSYNDKYEIRRKVQLSGSSLKRGTTNAAINKLGQKHAPLNLSTVHGLALTKKQKKNLLKKRLRN